MPTTSKTTTVKPTEPVIHNTLAEALAAFQANLPTIGKGNTAQVRSDKGNYSYSYADLADVVAAVIPPLAAQGLAWVTSPTMTDQGFGLKWALIHGPSGEQIEGFWPLPDPSRTAAQQVGSAMTYARRYTLTAVTGVAPDEDDDGAQATPAQRPAQRPVQSRPQAPVAAAAPEYLPVGVYDLAGIKTVDDAKAMFFTAQRAGHLPLMLRVGDADVPFGKWLQDTGTALATQAPAEEDPDRAAVLAYEAELAAQGDAKD